MNELTPVQAAMLETFQRHMNAEMTGDIETTMATMSDHPHLNHVPTMAGATGRKAVRRFYEQHLVGKFFPPNVEFVNVSRTFGDTRLVDEGIARFTHTIVMDWMLPGVAPTGKRVEVATAVIVQFKDGKIEHEHIYWDQASVLVQLGLLNPSGLPVSGVESAHKALDPQLPSRRI